MYGKVCLYRAGQEGICQRLPKKYGDPRIVAFLGKLLLLYDGLGSHMVRPDACMGKTIHQPIRDQFSYPNANELLYS